jgi:hypothetical protein
MRNAANEDDANENDANEDDANEDDDGDVLGVCACRMRAWDGSQRA